MTTDEYLVSLDRFDAAFLQGLLHTWRANFRPEPSEKALTLIIRIERAAKALGVDGTEDPIELEKRVQNTRDSKGLFFACWQHVKNYRKRRFLDDTFGKGARVEIRKYRRLVGYDT